MINVLDSKIFNRIAAGEVVEKPCSVVKELIENSIDSGATKIEIAIKDGGRYIQVSDNGCGILPSDVRTAFLPHATSKIKELKDLDAISTLGFRGEALPSIASVAKVTLKSKTADNELGQQITIENGCELSFIEVGAKTGTTVVVEDLFKNIPARLKFLKSDRSEENEISSMVQKLLIANYNISFTYAVNEKVIYQTNGGELKSVLYSVYGSSILNEYDYVESNALGISLFGYVSKPAYSKHNKQYQTLIINGRCVNSNDVSFWIYNCFSDYLMKRQYPAYVIFINMPSDLIDVNVHPSKMEVKFVDFGAVRKLLSNAIAGVVNTAVVSPKEIQVDLSNVAQKIAISKNSGVFDDFLSDYGNSHSVKSNAFEPITFKFNSPSAEKGFTRICPDSDHATDNINCAEEKSTVTSSKFNLHAESTDFYSDLLEYKYVGKFFNTYLLLEKNNQVIIIDQHAAHEKILYDEYVNNVDNGKNTTQDLLLPYVFDVNDTEAELIDKNMEEIASLGFVIGKFSGNSYSLSAVPYVLSEINLKDFVSALLEALKKTKLNKHHFIKSELMQNACKSAVKGEKDLTKVEIDNLINLIAERKIDLFCPHGRPIAVKIERSEIEKWFKRII